MSTLQPPTVFFLVSSDGGSIATDVAIVVFDDAEEGLDILVCGSGHVSNSRNQTRFVVFHLC